MAETMTTSVGTNSSLAHDIWFAVPRLAHRVSVLVVNYFPDHLDEFLTRVLTPARITTWSHPSATPTAGSLSATSASQSLLKMATSATTATTAATTAASSSQSTSMLSITAFLNLIRGATSFSNYILSKWALTTAIMMFALGRVHVFSSSRVPLRMNLFVRAALYSAPLISLVTQTLAILRALRCQTSPNWSLMRHQNASKHLTLDYAGGEFLQHLSASLLFWEDEYISCQAVKMTVTNSSQSLVGSLSLLWPLFLGLCASQFAESIAAALQGRQPITENSIFEISLAFAEAEALVSKPFELSRLSGKTPTDSVSPLKITTIKKKMNVTPEVLLLSLIFALSTITSNILAILNKRKKWRLVNTGVWGTAYLVSFVWSISHLFLSDDPEWKFQFPTVFIVSFLPHLVIIFGTTVCACIYSIGLLVTILSPPPGMPTASQNTIKERLYNAYHNLQANVYVAAGEHVRFNWEDEFFSTLLKAGFTLLTVASESVFLHQATNVRVGDLTWLERKRVNEFLQNQGVLFEKTKKAIPPCFHRSTVGAFPTSEIVDSNLLNSNCGYAIERKACTKTRGSDMVELGNQNSILTGRRTGLAIRFTQGVFWLCMGALATCLVFVIRKAGLAHVPEWLAKLMRQENQEPPDQAELRLRRTLDFYMLDDDGSVHRAKNLDVDVEAEMRKQQTFGSRKISSQSSMEAELDEKIYGWWKYGGFFGEVDSSGDYELGHDNGNHDNDDDDCTSVISNAASGWATDEEGVDEVDGQRTPTRGSPFPSRARGENDLLDHESLAALLDPRTIEQQQEARMLSRRLRSSRIMTRNGYQRQLARERMKILMSTRAFDPEGGELGREKEETRLEHFLTDQRDAIKAKSRQHDQTRTLSSVTSWNSGAPGMGNDGPLCVVCQDSPRTILLWPCGCLSICDDCRVSMATRNFTNCVCCRTSTEAFSRLYVP